MARLLVTGGAGFIGSNFVRYWMKAHPEDEIVNLDKLTYAGNLENLREVDKNPRYRFVQGDIAVEEDVSVAFEGGLDYVVNFAAETHVDRSIQTPGAFIKTDVFGTYCLLEACRRHGIKRYLQVGTDEVYGSVPEGSSRETDCLEPNSPYSASKAGGDHLVRAYHVTYGVDTVVTRASNNFGPFQYPEKVIPLFITNLLEGKKVPLYGDGMNIRDWLYVTDHCRGIETALLQGNPGEIYNIGGGCELTNIDLTRRILKETGRDDSFIERVKDRAGHDRRYSLDCSKLKTLGWKPLRSFDEALRETVEWYRRSEWWWKPIKSGEYREYYRKQYVERGSE